LRRKRALLVGYNPRFVPGYALRAACFVRQLILSAKWAAATPVAALPLAGHQQALTGNNNDLTFAIRL